MDEKLMFQYIMNYKAYRRIMISTRAAVTAVIVGGLLCFCIKSVAVGVSLGIAAACLGAMSIVLSLQKEFTYMVFNTRIVIKNKEKRADISNDNIKSVTSKRAFYEKDLSTCTVVIKAVNGKGRLKTYKLQHIFDGEPCAEYLKQVAAGNAAAAAENQAKNNQTETEEQ